MGNDDIGVRGNIKISDCFSPLKRNIDILSHAQKTEIKIVKVYLGKQHPDEVGHNHSKKKET